MRDGLDEFLAEFCEPLQRFLLRQTRDPELAADLSQEALLRAWKRRHTLQDQSLRKVWVFRIAVNLLRDHHRSLSRHRTEALQEHEPVTAEIPAEAQLTRQESAQRIRDAVDQLPPRQREVMHLFLVENLTPLQIAEVLGIDSRTVRANLSIARQQLRTRLADLHDESIGIQRPAFSPLPGSSER